MSERTAPALAQLDALIPRLEALPPGALREQLLDETTALRRAVAAFHMEAIRFRMYSVERHIAATESDPEIRRIFEALRHDLETAGFHTRSHSAP
jgi:hypothetical protein